jgi:Tfp pilus assembly major pilin PilA
MGIGVALMTVSSIAGGIVLGVSYLAILVLSIFIMIQRLHDLNKSGWMSLLLLVPLANIYIIVLLIFFKGTPGRNDYGLQAPPNKAWHWILALVMPILIIGILAAVAIPAYHDYVERAKAVQSSQQDTYSSEYTDESTYSTDEAYPTEDSGYESPVEEEAPTDYNTEAEPAAVDEVESDTPQ